VLMIAAFLVTTNLVYESGEVKISGVRFSQQSYDVSSKQPLTAHAF